MVPICIEPLTGEPVGHFCLQLVILPVFIEFDRIELFGRSKWWNSLIINDWWVDMDTDRFNTVMDLCDHRSNRNVSIGRNLKWISI